MRFPGVGSRAASFRGAYGVAKGLYWSVRFGEFAGVGDTVVYRLSAMDGPVRPRPLFLIGPESVICRTRALSSGELLKSRLRGTSSPDGFA